MYKPLESFGNQQLPPAKDGWNHNTTLVPEVDSRVFGQTKSRQKPKPTAQGSTAVGNAAMILASWATQDADTEVGSELAKKTRWQRNHDNRQSPTRGTFSACKGAMQSPTTCQQQPHITLKGRFSGSHLM
jgi:hypothetical protein